ncbi:MAG: glycosyltransferase [Candidatus Scalindua sp.]|jgi:glycosyltransferase involved in cell wall biosynthesis|nr:glycosyltransferase [Candidatus Scalindua sp.]MBT6049156.1 glycosyltransferase [Candidatus Scalindua sp.]
MSVLNDNESGVVYDSSAPTVSVIMNCLNCERYLREAIDSVFAQTYEDWEIIFWEDNASKDNSEKIAKSYGDKLRYFRSDVSLPLYGSRNLAVQKARGKYIAILDCDDMWLPTKLEEQIALLEQDVETGLVYSDAYRFNEKGKQKRKFETSKPYRGKIFSELLLCNFIDTQTVVIRREVFDSLDHWFDDRLIMSGDYDAYLRISYRWKVDYVDKPLAMYRVHRNSKSWRDGRKLLSVELNLVIENLIQNICGFEDKYSEGARALKRWRDVQLSLLDWENGDKMEARKRLSIYIHDGAYYFILSLLMYLPYRYAFYPCQRMYTKNIIAS